jgi:hypothetical protein
MSGKAGRPAQCLARQEGGVPGITALARAAQTAQDFLSGFNASANLVVFITNFAGDSMAGSATLVNIFFDPKAAFASIKEQPRAWLPLLVTIALSALMTYWWLSTVDFSWFRDQMALAADPNMKPEARAAMAQFITPGTMLWGSMASIVIATPIMYALSAVYFLLAGKTMGAQISYGKWFGFTAWSSLPRLLALPLMAVQILTSHGRVAPNDLNMVSLNYLVFHLPASNHWAGLVSGIDLTMIWTLVLTTLGLKVWTGRSTGACAFAAILPYALIYGLWATKIALIG